MKNYTVILTYDRKEKVYNVAVPALPGCLTWGRNKRQALSRAKEAIQGFLEVMKSFGDPIPTESGLHKIRVG
jgi:predicted RNase H-like HicB family nuclease